MELGEEWEKEGISSAFSATTYISNVLPKLAWACGVESFPKFKTPFCESYYPELDEPELLQPTGITLFKSLLGSANWIITLGRFDIAYATQSLARYAMAPRMGHLKALHHVFGYLRSQTNGKLVIDTQKPPIRES